MAAASVAGTYLFDKPGSGGDKSLKTLSLDPHGGVSYKEEGENKIETFVISGNGSWSISADKLYVVIRFPRLTKINTPKSKQLIPGMDAPHITEDDGFDILATDLTNAPAGGFAKHKWKRA